jgi:ABC transport system ATP-binding/permease protein
MDEPTNDLDIESLELLEDTLQTYPGTLLLVSHDRAFLDNVVTQTLVAEGNGKWQEYVGGYSDWLQQRKTYAPASAQNATAPATKERKQPVVKMSYKESRELELLPKEIEALEQQQTELTARMSAADYHRVGAEQMKADRVAAGRLERELEGKFERWTELEGRKSG